MNQSYLRIEAMRAKCDPDKLDNFSVEIIKILADNGINLRKDDGKLIQINISISIDNGGIFIIGLRYIKNDRMQTEDHFLCKKEVDHEEKEITPYYKGKLEKLLPEYKDTHKQQIEFGQQPNLNTDIGLNEELSKSKFFTHETFS